MNRHVAKVAVLCFYHLCRLRQIHQQVGAEVTTRLVLEIITLRLDYYKSVLAGLPQLHSSHFSVSKRSCAVNPQPQPVGSRDTRSAPAPLVASTLAYPVQLCSIMHSINVGRCPVYMAECVHVGRCPVYMAECVQTFTDNASRSKLRSVNSTLYVTPQLRTRFWEIN